MKDKPYCAAIVLLFQDAGRIRVLPESVTYAFSRAHQPIDVLHTAESFDIGARPVHGTEAIISKRLQQTGVPVHMKGFLLLKNAIRLLLSIDRPTQVRMMEDVYEVLAKYTELATTAKNQAGIVKDLNKALEKFSVRAFKAHSALLPDPGAVFGADLPCPYEIRVLHPEDFTDLYVPAWGNALCEDRKQLDMLGAGAYDGGRLVGLAGCSADGDEMWQIGIDVLPEYRRQGIASALTNRLAREIFAHGKVPFYGAAWSNVRSLRNGLRSGFRPAWAELSAEEIKEK